MKFNQRNVSRYTHSLKFLLHYNDLSALRLQQRKVQYNPSSLLVTVPMYAQRFYKIQCQCHNTVKNNKKKSNFILLPGPSRLTLSPSTKTTIFSAPLPRISATLDTASITSDMRLKP